MIESSVARYDDGQRKRTEDQDREFLWKCQRLAQMGFYETIRREVEKLEKKSEKISYQMIIDKLYNVGASRIIDNIDKYKAHDGKSIVDLIWAIDKANGFDKAVDWTSGDKIAQLKSRKLLFEKLKFGQEDRREYVRKVKENLGKDLFSARNIHDIQLFTKDGHADEIFQVFLEQQNLNTYTPKVKYQEIKEPAHKNATYKYEKFNHLEKRFVQLLMKIQSFNKERRAWHLLTSTETDQKLKKELEDQLTVEIENFFSSPMLNINNGIITVSFFCMSSEKRPAVTALLNKHSLNEDLLGMTKTFERSLQDKVIAHSDDFFGSSLDEIEKQINDLKNKENPLYYAYLEQLGSLKDHVRLNKNSDLAKIEDLKLNV